MYLVGTSAQGNDSTAIAQHRMYYDKAGDRHYLELSLPRGSHPYRVLVNGEVVVDPWLPMGGGHDSSNNDAGSGGGASKGDNTFNVMNV